MTIKTDNPSVRVGQTVLVEVTELTGRVLSLRAATVASVGDPMEHTRYRVATLEFLPRSVTHAAKETTR